MLICNKFFLQFLTALEVAAPLKPYADKSVRVLETLLEYINSTTELR